MAVPKRQLVAGPLSLRDDCRLLGRTVTRFSPLTWRPKSDQSTSIGGVLSAKEGVAGEGSLELKWGVMI